MKFQVRTIRKKICEGVYFILKRKFVKRKKWSHGIDFASPNGDFHTEIAGTVRDGKLNILEVSYMPGRSI